MSKHVFRFGSGSDGGAPAGLTCMATGGGADAALVIVGGEDGQAHVCHIGTKKVVATLRHFEASEMATSGNERDEDDVEHPMSVEAVGFCPAQPTWCATGGVDGKLKIWDLARDGGQLRHVCTTNDGLGSAADSITRLRWHPTFPLVFTAHISGKIQLWDARSGVLVHSLYGGQEQINDMDVQFSPMSQNIAFIVTASDDKAVRVFELDVNAALQRSVTTS
jgi:WD40 repeat protein